MQKILKGSKTEANLMAAFAGESQARNKYTFYGAKAKADGFAEIWFKLLHNGMPATGENLMEAAGGERYEYETMYPTFAKEAREEGFTKIAALFELVAKIEKEHMERYETLKAHVDNGTVFKKQESVTWICLNCGHVYEGAQPPQVCPVCEKPQSWFQVKAENY